MVFILLTVAQWQAGKWLLSVPVPSPACVRMEHVKKSNTVLFRLQVWVQIQAWSKTLCLTRRRSGAPVRQSHTDCSSGVTDQRLFELTADRGDGSPCWKWGDWLLFLPLLQFDISSCPRKDELLAASESGGPKRSLRHSQGGKCLSADMFGVYYGKKKISGCVSCGS